MTKVKLSLNEELIDFCQSCDRLWANRVAADKLIDFLHGEFPIKPDPKNFVSILFSIALTLVGFAALFYFSYSISGRVVESVIITGCAGLPAAYLIHLAVRGMVPNFGSQYGGEIHGDLENLGSAAGEIWQSIKFWVYGFLVLLILSMVVLFTFPLPRGQLYRFIGWLQKPYSSYLDIIDSKDKAALGRMCDWYLKALETAPSVFSSSEDQEVQGICKSAGKVGIPHNSQ